MPRWVLGLVLAPRLLTHLRFMVPRRANGATTRITHTPAPPTAITGRAGLTVASSLASGRGMAGAGDMAGAVAAMATGVAVMDTGAAGTVMDAVAMQQAADMLAEYAVA